MEPNASLNIAIIGLGTMGPGMALEFARAGHWVTGFDLAPESVEASQAIVRSVLNTLAEAGHMSGADTLAVEDRISYAQTLKAAVRTADIVVEAVSENIGVKADVFKQVDSLAPARCMIWSNTSTLNIFEAVPASRLGQTLIAHFFAPPHIIPLVEVVKGEDTSDHTVETTLALLKKMNKQPVLIQKYLPGFIINRILRNLGREAFFLLDNGYITKEDLDLAVKASIAPRMMVLGLIQRYDFTGLDLSARNLLDDNFFDPPVDNRPASLQAHIDKGELGVKSGRGFYDYSDRDLTDILKERDRHLLRVMDGVKFCLKKDRLV